jgi:hypothetical protein
MARKSDTKRLVVNLFDNSVGSNVFVAKRTVRSQSVLGEFKLFGKNKN